MVAYADRKRKAKKTNTDVPTIFRCSRLPAALTDWLTLVADNVVETR